MRYLYKILFLILSSTLLFGVTNFSHAQENTAEEGIQVHGDWTITVNDENGNFVKERSFENDLTSDGGALLSSLLAGEAVPGIWDIKIASFRPSESPCETSDGTKSTCRLTTDSSLSSQRNWAFDLSINSPDSGDNSGAFVLSGNFTASNDGNIYSVTTRNFDCPDSNTAPNNCSNASYKQFTSKDLDSQVNVSANQQVTVTVVISFS